MASAALIDFFTQRRAGRLAASARHRDRVARLSERARQQRRAAQALWSLGQQAEGLRLLTAALRASLDATAAAAGVDDDHWTEALGQAGLRDAAQYVAQADHILQTEVPELDREVRDEHGSAFADGLKLTNQVLDTLEASLLEPGAIRKRVVRRVLSALVTIGLGVVLAFWVRDEMRRERVSTSAVYENDPKFVPENLLDDDPSTEWVLPNAVPGWVQISLPAPKRLRAVRVVNGKNAPYDDRGVRELLITATDEGGHGVSKTITFEDGGDERRVELTLERAIEVRLEVVRYLERGGALADVELITE